MSYDFGFFRLTRPLDSLRDCDESAVADFADWRGVYERLRHGFPGLQWRQDEQGYRAHADAIAGGRFEVIIDFDTAINATYSRQYGIFRARGSHHADQVEFIRQIAVAVGFSAFDMQTGERLHLQAFDDEAEKPLTGQE